MARLINNKGTYLLQIEKSNHKGILALLSDLPGSYLYLESQDGQTLTFGFAEWDYDGMENATEMYSSQHLRNILSKISENPDPDLVITKDPIITSEEDKWYKRVFQQTTQRNLDFLEKLATDENISPTTYKWREKGLDIPDPHIPLP